jgi:histidyl-tRNA synthetase
MPQSRGFARLPGFRDFPPEDLALRSHIFEAWRRVSRRYGFLEYDAPPLESLELYAEKSGEELVGQLYEFTDKGDRRIALRPEMTPSLARVLAERSKALPKPIRWFAIPQLFRYERQQRGRLREHFQWNVDLVGEPSIEADAEVLAVALDGLVELGLTATDVKARVSDRILLGAVLGSLGVAADKERAAFSVIDKVEREPRERVSAKLTGPEVGLGAASAEALLALFEEPGLDRVESGFGENPAVASRLAELRRFVRVMSDLGFADFVEIDLSVVRGLAYYTGVVFEVFDRSGQFRAICGGGRYDRLLELVGGDPLPAVGFGMGDVVLSELLRDRGKVPEYRPRVDFYIVTVGPEQGSVARRIAAAQRRSGRSVVQSVSGQSMKRQFSSAASVGARATIVVGPDELARGVAVIKDMESGEQSEMSLESLTKA